METVLRLEIFPEMIVSILVVVGWVSYRSSSVEASLGMGGYPGARTGGLNGGAGGGMGMGRGPYLPPGYTMVDGELVEMSNKIIQRVGGGAGGTQYFSWTDQRGPPVFRRREIDIGRRFIVFPDRNYPPGDGHYVVLRKFTHGKGQRRGGNIYEAFYLDLGDSINAMVTNFNSLAPASVGGMMGGRRGIGGAGFRQKRKTEVYSEVWCLRAPKGFNPLEIKDYQEKHEEKFDSSEAEFEGEQGLEIQSSKNLAEMNIA